MGKPVTRTSVILVKSASPPKDQKKKKCNSCGKYEVQEYPAPCDGCGGSVDVVATAPGVTSGTNTYVRDDQDEWVCNSCNKSMVTVKGMMYAECPNC